MNILVSVRAGRAQAQLAALQAQQQGLNTAVAAGNRQAPLGQRHIGSLMKFGNQLQWTGRMLQYNFTVPILAATAAATLFALEQDKAFVHMEKVYGDTTAAAAQFRKEQGLGAKAARQLANSYRTDELEALDKAFTAISNHYGVQKKEVLEVAGAWAAAGVSGVDLAKSVNQTMKAIIIGDMESAKATKALISIQAQYNLSTKELGATLANLNSVENATGATMQDLIVGFEKAAGVARSAGVETQQLAAYMAALVPATGSATTAGNALKTIMSRLIAPTKETRQVLDHLGFATKSYAWNSATVTERLQLMAERFQTMSTSAKNATSSVIASRWQVNRFDVLMREIVSTTGFYAKALDSAADQGASFTRMQRELNTVLESDPRQLQRMWVMLQNAMAEVIRPLIPFIIYLAQEVAQLAQAFSELDPHTQKLVLFFVMLLAAVGPVVRYMGALTTLFGVFSKAVQLASTGVLKLSGALLWMLTPVRKLGTLLMGTLGFIASGFRLMVIRSLQWLGILTVGMLKVFLSGAVVGSAKIMWALLLRINAVGAVATLGIWAKMRLGMLAILAPLPKLIALIFRPLLVMMGAIGTVLLHPWGLAIGAIIGLLYAFRTQISQIWNNITGMVSESGFSIVGTFQSITAGILNAFYRLPQGVQDVMIAVVTVVRDAALAVYEWFQYINPWAQHSPSLVQNVNTGIDSVVSKFKDLSGIRQYTSAAYDEIKRFGDLTAKLGVSATAVQAREDRAALKKAGAGQALASYNRLISLLNKLNPILKTLEVRMNAQQRVVDLWQSKVDKANRALDRQQDKLDDLQDTLSKYQSRLDKAQESLDYYASAPIKGMRAMEEQIFQNQMAQTRLRHEMMKFEDVNGTFDEIKSKIEAINGAQEVLRGTQTALRAAGAGSEILGQYDKEMKKLDQQKDKYQDAANVLSQMQARLDALQRQAERLDLVKAMRFDELQHQIEMAANRMKELSFERIMKGIRGANDQIDKYGPKVDAATQAVNRQQKVVDKLTASRDRLQTRLDKEQASLDRIKKKYDEVNGAIQAINSSISDVLSSASKMNEELEKKAKKKPAAGAKPYISPGLQNLMDAGNAGYDDPGGKGIPPRVDWSNQSDAIDKFTENLSRDTAKAFEQLNPFAPLRDKAVEFWNWTKQKSVQTWGEVVDFMSRAFAGVTFDVGGGEGLSRIWRSLETTGEFITQVLRDVAAFGKQIWDIIGPDVRKASNEIWKSLKRAWDKLGPLFASFGELIGPAGKALLNLWTILKPLLALILGPFIIGMKIGFQLFANTIGPILDMIVDVIAGVIKVIRGSVKVVVGVLTGDWGMAVSGLGDIFVGTFDQIWGIIKGFGKILGGVGKVIEGIWDTFVWLYDQLVGNSIVPDLIDGIIWWFNKLVEVGRFIWSKFVKPVIDAFKFTFNVVITLAKTWWAGLMLAWAVLTTIGLWFWDNVLKPIWDQVARLWPLVQAGFSMWWEGVKLAWAGLRSAAVWLWKNVLQPVWKRFKNTWDDLIWPSLKLWWAGLKKAWNKLTDAGKWIWNEVLKPVWNKVLDLWRKVQPELSQWWDRIKRAWNALKNGASWWWENVLKPIWNKLVDLWNKVKPELQNWWDRMKRAWNKLTTLGTWIKENVMDPVFSAIKSGWTKVKEWLVDSKDLLTEPVKGIMGSVRSVMNTVIGGLNKVSEMLPGIDFHVSLIPKFASGTHGLPTKRVGSGFMTHGARAIVGEGKPNYPEFVIPTDPTHRNRAKSLLAMAAAKVGGGALETVMNARNGGGIPQYGLGGWIEDKYDDVKDMAKKLRDQLADLGKYAIGKIMNPLLNVAEEKIKETNWGPSEAVGLYATNKVQRWVTDSDKNLNDFVTAAKKAQNSGAGRVPVGVPDNPGGRGYWKGGTFTNLFIAHMKKAEQIGHGSINVTQGGFRPTTSYSGTSHHGDALDMQVNYALGKALRRVGVASGDRTGLGNWSPHIHAIPGPAAGSAAGSGPWQFSDYVARGGASQSMRSPWGLASGGIAKARRGGVWANLAEGGQDEAVIPLPRDWERGLFAPKGGDTHVHLHGDLVLPNIKNGDDAQTLIDNLKKLAED